MGTKNSPPESGGVARSAGVVPKPQRFGFGTTPRTTFGRAALLTKEGDFLFSPVSIQFR
jgi:hypothetical protein